MAVFLCPTDRGLSYLRLASSIVYDIDLWSYELKNNKLSTTAASNNNSSRGSRRIQAIFPPYSTNNYLQIEYAYGMETKTTGTTTPASPTTISLLVAPHNDNVGTPQ